MSNSNKLPDGVLVDEEDLERVLKLKWHINTVGYVVSDQRKHKRGKYIRLHRFILQPNKNELIDHKNRNPLDNRKCNLRIADKSTNAMNREAQSNSSTGYKGITWDKQKKRWRTYASKKGKQYHLGFYKTIDEAIEGYNSRIEDIHGEWAVKQ